MASITQQQKAAIRTLVRRANRRIERAGAGQTKALEYYVKQATGGTKWSAATKGLTQEQAALKLKQLESFLSGKSTTITGWREIKSKNVSSANETLTSMGYDLEDEELAEILMQIDAADKKEFYRAINLVQAAKESAGEAWQGSKKQIQKALEEKATYQQALQKALEARNDNSNIPF